MKSSVSIVGILLAACSTLTGPDESRIRGITHFYRDPVVISTPERVAAGVPFEVTVRTYGGGCIRENGTDVAVSGLTADVTPYDIHIAADICTTELRMFEHRASLTIRERGTAILRFHGWAVPADSAVVATRHILVE